MATVNPNKKIVRPIKSAIEPPFVLVRLVNRLLCYLLDHDGRFVTDEIGDIRCRRCGADLTD